MKFLFSWVGVVFFGVYAAVALVVRVIDITSDAWVLNDYVSGLVSMPGSLILEFFGCDRERVIVPGMCVNAVLAYLAGAAIELAVKTFSR